MLERGEGFGAELCADGVANARAAQGGARKHEIVRRGVVAPLCGEFEHRGIKKA